MEYNFNPYQKVLVRDGSGDKWVATLFSHIEEGCGNCYRTVNGNGWWHCIPYEGHEHLLGTIDNPETPRKEYNWGDKIEIQTNGRCLNGIIIGDGNYSDYFEVLVQLDNRHREYHISQIRHSDW